MADSHHGYHEHVCEPNPKHNERQIKANQEQRTDHRHSDYAITTSPQSDGCRGVLQTRASPLPACPTYDPPGSSWPRIWSNCDRPQTDRAPGPSRHRPIGIVLPAPPAARTPHNPVFPAFWRASVTAKTEK